MKNTINISRIKIVKIIFECILLIAILALVIQIYFPNFFGTPRSVNLRTRDVARKTELSQIQSVIIAYQEENGEWPQRLHAIEGMSARGIENELLEAGMSYVPGDPIQSNVVSGLGDKSITGDYVYMVSVKDGITDGGFILMAKTELELGSNWVVCDNGEGKIESGVDLSEIKLCNEVSKGKTCSNSNGICTYKTMDELRYILIH